MRIFADSSSQQHHTPTLEKRQPWAAGGGRGVRYYQAERSRVFSRVVQEFPSWFSS